MLNTMNTKTDEVKRNEKDEDNKKPSNRKRNLYVLVGVLVVGSLLFRFIVEWQIEQYSILYIGLPALMTLLLIRFSKPPKSLYGTVFLVMTLFLLMAAIFMGEGAICILMAAPILYGVAALVIFIYNFLKHRNKDKIFSFIIIPVLVILSQPLADKNELQVVETSIIIKGTPNWDVFSHEPDLMMNYPNFFKLGFPQPNSTTSEGNKLGDHITIQFESTTRGVGELVFEIKEKNKNKIIFDVVGDDSHISHWLTWRKVEVNFEQLSNDQTKITWISEYTCDLAPAWYFETIEDYTVDLMHEHLLNSYFLK